MEGCFPVGGVVGVAGGGEESRERRLIPSLRKAAISGEMGLGAAISASSSCAGKGAKD